MLKKGDVPNVYRQHTQKNNPSTRKERRNLEKRKTSHNKESPKNSGERGSPNLATIWTTPQGIWKKITLSLWYDNSTSSQILRLHSPQNIKISKLKPTVKLLFSSYLVPLNFYSRRRFLIEAENTQTKPKVVNSNVQSCLIFSQWIKIWSTNSSLSIQRIHLLTKGHPLFINVSIVNSFPHIPSQAKKQVLRGALDPQTSLARNKRLFSTLR